jgi:hypothetical protein
MSHKPEIKSILDKEGLPISNTAYDTQLMTALGIGDILISFALLKQKLIPIPIVINLTFFENDTYPNPANALEFRVKLIKQILESNNFPQSCVIYTYGVGLNQHIDRLPHLRDWSLCITDTPKYSLNLKREYIIFHTKYRSVWKKQHESLDKVRKLYGQLKINNYDIILLGERKMVDTPEQQKHTISTIYDDLIQLRNNNQVIDLTQETLYNSLDINQYIMDCNLIKNATKNITLGLSGQLTNSLVFNQKSVICLRYDNEGVTLNQHLNDIMFYDYQSYEKILMSL